MSRLRSIIIALSIVTTVLASMPLDANADGPLRRWFRGLKTNKACCGKPAPAPATCAPNPYNLQPGQCMTTCQKTCTRTVVNYVPCTAYRTVTKRVPVTQYRPETTSDPCTGCTVTCMKPCTSYTYQCQRVPYTTYRPVYRQETYKVPVTTITNNCATGNCSTGTCSTGVAAPAPSGCNTCVGGQTPAMSPPLNNYGPVPTPAPQTSTSYEYPQGSLSTGSSFTPTPADQSPSLTNPTSYQPPVTERINTPIGTGYQASSAPARIDIQAMATRSPIRQRWSYSPVRMASYEKPTTTTARLTPSARYQAPASQARSERFQPVKRNGWVEVD